MLFYDVMHILCFCIIIFLFLLLWGHKATYTMSYTTFMYVRFWFIWRKRRSGDYVMYCIDVKSMVFNALQILFVICSIVMYVESTYYRCMCLIDDVCMFMRMCSLIVTCIWRSMWNFVCLFYFSFYSRLSLVSSWCRWRPDLLHVCIMYCDVIERKTILM